jgi:hypothetical protein
MAPDTAAMILITVLDPATSKTCASKELMTILRSEKFWQSFGAWLEGPVRGLGLPAVTGILCRLAALKMNRPAFMKILAEEVGKSHVHNAAPEYIAQSVALLVPPKSFQDCDDAVERVFTALQSRAREQWGGKELILAIRGSNSAVTRYGEAARAGVLTIAHMIDEVACEKVEHLEPQDAYTLISEMEEAKFMKGRLMGLTVRKQMKGYQPFQENSGSKRGSG